jgi:hypothetical protein
MRRPYNKTVRVTNPSTKPCRGPDAPRSKSRRPTRGWRIVVFVALFVISAVAGAVLYGKSHPVSLAPLAQKHRPAIDIFVSDPSATVTLSVEVGGGSDPLTPGLRTNEAAMFVKVHPPTARENVYFLIFIQGAASDPAARTVPNYLGIPGEHEPHQMLVYAGNTAENLMGEETKLGYPLTRLRVPNVLHASSDTIQAELPVLNNLYLPHAPKFTASGCDLATATRTQSFVPAQINWTPGIVPARSCGPASFARPNVKTFYSPTTLRSLEQLDVDLSGYQILSDLPTGGGTVVSRTAGWREEADLAPSLSAVRPSAQDIRSRNGFLAGIALAIAGAALIAALQERGSSRRS